MSACCVWDFRISLLDDHGDAQYLESDSDDDERASHISLDYEDQRDEIQEFLKEFCKKWCFQLEAGHQDGYLHFQGRFSLKEKLRKNALMKLFETNEVDIPYYLEPTSKELARSKDMFYVMKQDTRVAGPWKDDDKELFVPVQYRQFLDKSRLFPYQLSILHPDKSPDFRTVNLVVDIDGNKGKSVASALAELCGKGIDVPPILDSKELIQIVCDICISRQERSPSPIIIDLPRSVDKKKLGGMYTAIEQIKKGKLYDPRHSYKSWWINSPDVWVFTNAHPDLSMLSNDRWKLWSIDKDMSLVPYEPPCLVESPEAGLDVKSSPAL